MITLTTSFFARPAKAVAKELPGMFLDRTVGKQSLRALIVQAEAFDGTDGRPTRKGMEYGPGYVFVMNFRGTRFLNLCTERSGVASCVMVSAIMLGGTKIEGPGRVAKALKISSTMDGTIGELSVLQSTTSFASVAKRDADRAENSEAVYRLTDEWLAACTAKIAPKMLRPYADTLARMVLELGGTQAVETSDLWERVRSRWTLLDLIDAVEAYQDSGDLKMFRSLQRAT